MRNIFLIFFLLDLIIEEKINGMSIVSDMTETKFDSKEESEIFSTDFVSAGRYRGGPHGFGQRFIIQLFR